MNDKEYFFDVMHREKIADWVIFPITLIITLYLLATNTPQWWILLVIYYIAKTVNLLKKLVVILAEKHLK